MRFITLRHKALYVSRGQRKMKLNETKRQRITNSEFVAVSKAIEVLITVASRQR